MKVLNLYAGIGGNRRNWKGCDVTAIEYNKEISLIYKTLHPEDNLIVCDAHEYLIKHSSEFDFIWSSPPCQSHSSFRQNICVNFRGSEPVYPDMNLYQEIIYLSYNCTGKYVVENVIPYYDFLIEPTVKIGRNAFWSNFNIPPIEFKNKSNLRVSQIKELEEYHGINLEGIKIKNKRQVLRNCVNREVGEYIFDCYRKVKPKIKQPQLTLPGF